MCEYVIRYTGINAIIFQVQCKNSNSNTILPLDFDLNNYWSAPCRLGSIMFSFSCREKREAGGIQCRNKSVWISTSEYRCWKSVCLAHILCVQVCLVIRHKLQREAKQIKHKTKHIRHKKQWFAIVFVCCCCCIFLSISVALACILQQRRTVKRRT